MNWYHCISVELTKITLAPDDSKSIKSQFNIPLYINTEKYEIDQMCFYFLNKCMYNLFHSPLLPNIALERLKKSLNQIILTLSPFRLLVWRSSHDKKVKIEAFYSLRTITYLGIIFVLSVLKLAWHYLFLGKIIWVCEVSFIANF